MESTAIHPWEVSTAFIRNGPMTSLWELGALHRGAAWETLRLSKFYGFGFPAVGMRNYVYGDANILNQVKADLAARQ